MTNYTTTGYLTDVGRTIKFTITLDKPIVKAEIALSELNIQVRQHDSDALILNEDVMLNNEISVLTEVQDIGILVTLSKSTMFVEANNTPVSIFIVSANGTFYDKEDGKFVEVVMADNYVKSMKSCLPNTSSAYDLPANLISASIGCYQLQTNTLVLDTTKQRTVENADSKNEEIITLKKYLYDTDYVVVKTMESLLSSPPSTYAEFVHRMTDAYAQNVDTIDGRRNARRNARRKIEGPSGGSI